MAVHHNNVLANNHFRKDWQRRVKVWFDQPGAKKRRRNARATKAAKLGNKPVNVLRPAVRCPTLKYNTKVRAGRGFSLDELKAAKIGRHEARAVGIPVDHRRRNVSEEGLAANVERLQAYKARVVVVPSRTKANKSKRAEIKNIKITRDAQAAFPIQARAAVEKPRAITAEEREVEAFRHLREERAKHRNEGARAAREKKKEEEAAAAKK